MRVKLEIKAHQYEPDKDEKEDEEGGGGSIVGIHVRERHSINKANIVLISTTSPCSCRLLSD